MISQVKQPEVYWTKPTPHCPNSILPVLVYRNVLTHSPTEENVREKIQPNEWVHGGTFHHYPKAHFHSNTHECYAAIAGSTKCLYGVGPLENDTDGVTFEMAAGDIAVHAAGVSHRNVESSDGYTYMGFYPKGSPKWNNNYCNASAEETKVKAEESKQVQTPDFDPIYGFDGPLPQLWRTAIANA